MEFIRPAFGAHVDHGRIRALIGHEEARLNFELVDVGHRYVHRQLSPARAADLDTVDGVAVVGSLDAAYDYEAAGMSNLASKRGTPLGWCRAASKEGQLEEVAPVEGQFCDTLGIHHRADHVGLGLQQHGRGLHGHDVCNLADGQLNIDGGALADLNRQIRYFLGGEAFARDANGVHARRDVRVGVVAGFVRRDLLLGAALDVDEDHRGSRNDRAACIGHGACDRGATGNALAPQCRGQEQRSKQQSDR